MIVWSSPIVRSGLTPNLRKIVSLPKSNHVFKCQVPGINQIQVRTCKSKGGTFNIYPSNFFENKAKDLVKFHTVIICAPFIAILLYANIFIGPATLKPIPEGYEPKYWEYHRHPISRFICQYLTENPQKTYEKMCHGLFYCAENSKLRKLEKKVKFLIADRRDFQAWYHSPAYLKYTKKRIQDIQDKEEKELLSSGFPVYK